MPPKNNKNDSWSDKLSRMRRKVGSLSERHGLENGYRSGLEFKVGKLLHDLGIEFRFEDPQDTIIWVPLPLQHKYHPDFVLVKTKAGKTLHLILETKGRFMPEDMAKQLAIKLQNPTKDIRFVFQNPNGWYRKAKQRTYAKWCEENGFKYCGIKDIEKKLTGEWINE